MGKALKVTNNDFSTMRIDLTEAMFSATYKDPVTPSTTQNCVLQTLVQRFQSCFI